MRVVTGREMQAIDKEAIEKFGVLSLELMERAGAEVARAAQRMLSGGVGKNVVVVAGKGNNGGDGFVTARRLHETGLKVKLFLLSPPEALTGDASAKYQMVKDVLESTSLNEENLSTLTQALDQADLIIDAIFGTGFSGRVEAFPEEIIRLINQSKAPVLSVDIPSGVEADTGKVNGSAVRADETVTFGLPKLGEVIYP
ncbi:MAG: NAD(P)H-hydrate epimerase, partial [Actinomycetota bacterium]